MFLMQFIVDIIIIKAAQHVVTLIFHWLFSHCVQKYLPHKMRNSIEDVYFQTFSLTGLIDGASRHFYLFVVYLY